jgi:hypothetical protein
VPFDPAALGGSHKVEIWEPGRRIRLVRRSGCGPLVGLAFALGGGGLLAFAMYTSFGPIPAVALGGVVALTGWLAVQPQATEFDWGSQRWSFTSSTGRTRVAAADVREVSVVTATIDKNIYREKHSHEHPTRRRRRKVMIERPPAYVGVVKLVHEVREDRKTPKLQRQVVWSTPEGPDRESRYPLATPFAEELARVIGQPCRVLREEAGEGD